MNKQSTQAIAFVILGLVWGSSFFWTSLALRELGPLNLVAIRLLMASIGMFLLLWLRKEPLPRDPAVWRSLVILGVLNAGLPLVLVATAQQSIPSSLAAILNATTPLFTVLLSAWLMRSDDFSYSKLFGVLVGFAGIVVLMSRDLFQQGPGSLTGPLLMMGSSLCYAFAAIFARRRLSNVSSLVQAGPPFFFGDLVVWAAIPFLAPDVRLPVELTSWVALLWLSLINTCAAYTVYYWLLKAWGPTRASMVTYVVPVVGLILGLLLLGEPAYWQLWAGTALVFAGILAVNWQSIRTLRDM